MDTWEARSLFREYAFYTATDRGQWQRVAAGEFSNIPSNAVEQRVSFEVSPARIIKLRALTIHGEEQRASFGEIGAVTVNPQVWTCNCKRKSSS